MLARSGRNHAREPVRISVGKPDDAPDVAHGALRVHLVERHDLRDAAIAVFLADVFEHFAAPFLAEIDVDVGRRNAFRIQEPLEDEPVLQRIDIGNSENISGQGTGGRTAPGADWNPALFREMDEVPDDQQITDEPGLLEHAQFVIEPLDQLRISSRALAEAIVQTLVTKLSQIRLARFAFRHRVFRIFRNAKLQREIDAIGDLERIRDRLGMVREKRPHFVRRFEIKLRRITHPPFVLHHLAGADADHHVVRLVVAPLQKMHIVGRDQAEPEFLREARQHLVAFVLRLDAVVVHFQKEILRAEDVAKFRHALARFGQIVRLDRHVDFALEATAQSDQTGRMRREQFLVDPRFVMESVEVRRGNQLHQIAIAGLVLRQQGEMVSRVALIIRPVLDRSRRHVRLAADDRFDTRLGRFLVKFDRPVQIPVVGDRHRGHLEFCRLFHQLLHPHRPVEEGIFRVEVEVNEGIGRHPTPV